MKWQDLTAPQFAQAVTQTQGVCIVPLGVVEKHGEHLPLGTDYLTANTLAERAAALEPALIFPPYYFGQVNEARHQPGTIAVRCTLVLELLENVCAEIARNGLKKIVLLNTHGGNSPTLRHFLKMTLEQPGAYTLYVIDISDYHPQNDPGWLALKQVADDQHAGEIETSVMLTAYPELVHLDQIAGNPHSLARLAHLQDVRTSVTWNSKFPDHYAGDAKFATPAKGEYLWNYMTRRVAQHLARIKADTTAPALLQEHLQLSQHPGQNK
ncbi:MAG: creatininase family protein [Phycisphaerae bacterium]